MGYEIWISYHFHILQNIICWSPPQLFKNRKITQLVILTGKKRLQIILGLWGHSLLILGLHNEEISYSKWQELRRHGGIPKWSPYRSISKFSQFFLRCRLNILPKIHINKKIDRPNYIPNIHSSLPFQAYNVESLNTCMNLVGTRYTKHNAIF